MMAKKKLKVTGLELETEDGKKVSLTLGEAKDLYEQLDELFSKEVPGPAYPIYIDRYRPYWQQPYYSWTTTASGTQVSNAITGMKISYLSGQQDTAGNPL